jgi:hypothetical protein
MQREHQDRMRRSMRPGTGGGGGGGGSYSVGSEGRIQNGHFSFTRPEDKTVVVETHRFHEGHEITITERLRMGDDGTESGPLRSLSGEVRLPGTMQ